MGEGKLCVEGVGHVCRARGRMVGDEGIEGGGAQFLFSACWGATDGACTVCLSPVCRESSCDDDDPRAMLGEGRAQWWCRGARTHDVWR